MSKTLSNPSLSNNKINTAARLSVAYSGLQGSRKDASKRLMRSARCAEAFSVVELNMTDGQVELWWFVVVQPPDAFP